MRDANTNVVTAMPNTIAASVGDAWLNASTTRPNVPEAHLSWRRHFDAPSSVTFAHTRSRTRMCRTVV